MDKLPTTTMKYVNTGEVNSGGIETVLNSGAIGSCIVVTAFDPIKHIGAMAHILLPGTFPSKNGSQRTRYAHNAIEEMLCQLAKFGIGRNDIEVCLIGGANVLKREKDTIGKENLISVEEILKEKHIAIKAKSVGGFERRTVLLDIFNGCIYFTVGNSIQKVLWQSDIKQ